MRKLVTIRTVSEVNPIEGADSIECLTVEGWKVVSQKGNFKIGDPCVYFEIDSFLPDGNPLWQDLVDRSSREFEGKKGHVLRTIKLRGQVSQGFCIPLSEVTALPFRKETNGSYTRFHGHRDMVFDVDKNITDWSQYRDHDWADYLGVKKYEAPIPSQLAGQVKGAFPSLIKKTDQERCQNLAAEIFADLDAKYEVTVKLDGTSMTVYHDPEGTGGVCSRNLELKTTDENKDNTMVKLAREGLQQFCAAFPHIAVQGELMGPGIQGNRENLKKPTFFVFDMFDMVKGRYLTSVERMQLILDGFDAHIWHEGHGDHVRHVPVLHYEISLRELGITNTQELLAFAEGKSLTHDIREGVVFKRLDGQFSFKAISNKFLLKQKE